MTTIKAGDAPGRTALVTGQSKKDPRGITHPEVLIMSTEPGYERDAAAATGLRHLENPSGLSAFEPSPDKCLVSFDNDLERLVDIDKWEDLHVEVNRKRI